MRAIVAMVAAFILAGCSQHSIEPRPGYDNSVDIPMVELVELIGFGGNFDLRWDYPDSIFKIVDGFYVERAPWAMGVPTGDFTRLNQELLQRREYEDRSGLPEGSYVYRVISETAAGVTSLPSNSLVGTVDLDPPGPPVLSLQLGVELGQQVVELSWTATEDDILFFRIYRDPPLCDLCPPLFAEISERTFTDSLVGPLNGKPQVYYYWVRSVDDGLNESPNSNIEGIQIEF